MVRDYSAFTRVTASHLQGDADQPGYDIFKTVWSDPANPRVMPEAVQTVFDSLGDSNPRIKGMRYETIVTTPLSVA